MEAWLGPLVLLPVLAVNLMMASDRRASCSYGPLPVFSVCSLIRPWLPPGCSPKRELFAHPFSPPWMIGLWLNFAATLNQSLGWLHGRPLLAALFGAIGGPLAYYGGARLGATETLPGIEGMVLLAIGWGVMTPLLFRLATILRR